MNKFSKTSYPRHINQKNFIDINRERKTTNEEQ
jgi:hypothetical protein